MPDLIIPGALLSHALAFGSGGLAMLAFVIFVGMKWGKTVR